MLLNTIFLALLPTTIAAAVPAARRACTTLTSPVPIALSKASSSSPSTSQVLTFTPPASAAGPCSLLATFPAGYPIASTGAAKVNVFAVGGPSAGSLVGTVTFAAGERRTINSFACRPEMKFRLELAGPGAGSVQVVQAGVAGVVLTYGC
ncbi:hypothetical protein QBC39DRAFT_418121 [Podospora conica]|nr:hypothetical protein QBC39DRAFT_418121 [Schizothecium conicum]